MLHDKQAEAFLQAHFPGPLWELYSMPTALYRLVTAMTACC